MKVAPLDQIYPWCLTAATSYARVFISLGQLPNTSTHWHIGIFAKMDSDELAEAVAVDEGHHVVEAVHRLNDGDRTILLTEAAVIGAFLLQCASLALQLWQNSRDSKRLIVELVADEKFKGASPSLEEEERFRLAGLLLRKLSPSDFAQDELLATEAKRSWLADLGTLPDYQSDFSDRFGFVNGGPVLAPFADQKWWVLCNDFGWRPEASKATQISSVTVPKGFVTDLASVPSQFWPLLRSTGRYGAAAILHDWLYWDQQVDRRQADQVFDEGMMNMEVSDFTRKVMWASVRLFGGSAWRSNAKAYMAGARRVVTTLPADVTATWTEWQNVPGVLDPNK